MAIQDKGCHGVTPRHVFSLRPIDAKAPTMDFVFPVKAIPANIEAYSV